MTIAPVEKRLEVNVSAAKAFEIFTAGIDDWWPKATHSLSQNPDAKVSIETRVGGQITEVAPDGATHIWGEIKEWAPGERLRFSWGVRHGMDKATEVEVTFTSLAAEKTLVRLTHRGWEVHGEDGPALREQYHGGWDGVLGDGFGGACLRAAA